MTDYRKILMLRSMGGSQREMESNMSVGPQTEHVVAFFLESGKVPEQGYKACASLTKLGERYGKERLENA